ncbi:MAG TPA: hypothetical protein VFY18_09775 [Candidatus Limnocylindrales bacterium]|nr:hypothetical protein [Candidatus Limnocylindrales bacterium]
MRVRRGLLFWGLFLIPLGALPLLVRAGALDGNRLVDAWRLWPLILVGVGLAILVGRTRVAIVGTMAIALVLGTMGGAALASGSLWIGALGDCGVASGPEAQHLDRSGTFGVPATTRLDLRCGTLNVGPTNSADWSLEAVHRGPAPVIDATANGLDVRVPAGAGDRRQDWTVRLPAAAVRDIGVTANAASASLDLAGMTLTRLDAEMNAGDLRVDATSATIDRVRVTMNAGRIRLTVGPTALTGDLSVNAGAIDVCVPDNMALRFDVTDQLTFVNNLGARGLSRSGAIWTRDATGGGPVVDLSVDGNAASFTLNPEGGC